MSAAILLDSLLAEDVFTISIINRHYEPIRLSLTRDPSSTPESREEWSEILTQSGLSQHRNPADVIVEADDAAFRREVEDAVQRQNLRWFPCQKEDGSWVDKADVERGWEFCRLADGEKHKCKCGRRAAYHAPTLLMEMGAGKWLCMSTKIALVTKCYAELTAKDLQNEPIDETELFAAVVIAELQGSLCFGKSFAV